MNDMIELVSVVNAKNSMGDTIETLTYQAVFADDLSVRQSEHYQAMATGLRPEKMFEVNSIEYQGQGRVRHPVGSSGKIYTIIRTYKKGEKTELVCQGLVNQDANA